MEVATAIMLVMGTLKPSPVAVAMVVNMHVILLVDPLAVAVATKVMLAAVAKRPSAIAVALANTPALALEVLSRVTVATAILLAKVSLDQSVLSVATAIMRAQVSWAASTIAAALAKALARTLGAVLFRVTVASVRMRVNKALPISQAAVALVIKLVIKRTLVALAPTAVTVIRHASRSRLRMQG